MPRQPRVTAQKLLTVLNQAGFYVHHQRGSHINLRHHTKTHLRLVVPNHKRGTLAPKTLRSILNQAELTVEQLRELV